MKDNNIGKTIGYRIAALLAIKDIKQKTLAQYMGVCDNVVSCWCSGSRTPSTEQIIKISKYFNVSSDYVLGLSDAYSINTNVQEACKTTGLNEETIEHLKSLCILNYERDILNSVLQNIDYFIIERIFEAITASARQQKIENIIAKKINELYELNISENNISFESIKRCKNNKAKIFYYSLLDEISNIVEKETNSRIDKDYTSYKLQKDIENVLINIDISKQIQDKINEKYAEDKRICEKALEALNIQIDKEGNGIISR